MERSNSMARQKRVLDSNDSEEDQPNKKRPALVSVIVEALKVDSLQKLCSSLEPILRKVVSEELECALAKLGPSMLNGRASPKRIEGPDCRNLQLHFKSKLALPLFTGGKVEGEQGATIHVVLLDVNTNIPVTTGRESSVKLDIVVLDGDFNNEDDEDWTQEKFESHVVKEREGKRPLLAGDLQVTLKEGRGTLGKLTFTDNSSWIRSKKFRLGLKVASGFCEGVCIREAKTDAFAVKDHRGELYMKNHPPALTDEVWRLEKIGKDGSFHKKLNSAGIFTVEDLLQAVVTDLQWLRNILGSGMSNKMWNLVLEHAKTGILRSSQSDLKLPTSFDHLFSLPSLPPSIPSEQPSMNPGLTVGGYDDNVRTRYSVRVQNMNLNAPNQLDGTSFFPQNQLINTMQQAQPLRNENVLALGPPQSSTSGFHADGSSNLTSYGGFDGVLSEKEICIRSPEMLVNKDMQHLLGTFNMNGPRHPSINVTGDGYPYSSAQTSRNENVLVLGPPQSSTSGFHVAGSSNPTSNGELDDFFSEEEIRIKRREMLENEDMQHLLRPFSMDVNSHASFNVNGDGYSYSSLFSPNPSPSYQTRSSSKAAIYWFKFKVAMRCGIHVRKKAAERRARIVELGDS